MVARTLQSLSSGNGKYPSKDKRRIIIHKKLLKTLESIIYVKLYTENKLNIREIAEETAKPQSTVRRRLIQYGVYRETPKIKDKNIRKLRDVIDSIMYKKMYIDKELSTRDIAKELGVSQSQVRRKLEKYNIKVRTDIEGKQTRVYKDKHKKNSERLKIRESRKCVNCDEEFMTRPCDTRKTCSDSCLRNYMSDLNYTRVVVTCDTCGKELLRTPSRVNSNENQFCDSTCYGKWRSENLVGEDNPSYFRIETQCKNCGKTMYVLKNRYENNKNIYCDVECMANYFSKSGKFRGSNSPTWKGGRLIPRKDYGYDWKRNRNITRKRDKYTCQRCGKSEEESKELYGEELSVHHIRPFRKFNSHIDANKLDNLVSLCKECHTFVHSRENKENKKEFLDEG